MRADRRARPSWRAWTHREPDDPGIALLEGAAILGDILTFYQEHYANEAYLRTAAWRESVAELVRLTGYRLAPGIGGRATFAFEVTRQRAGDDPRRASRSRPISRTCRRRRTSRPTRELRRLSAPRRASICTARGSYAAALAAGATSSSCRAWPAPAMRCSLAAFELKAGDRLMLLPNEAMWSVARHALSASQQTPQVVIVEKVTRMLGRVDHRSRQAARRWPGTRPRAPIGSGARSAISATTRRPR